jgi:large conductance mechanosensitive channel
MLKEFREFIAKGNMLDLAVGIVIGAAFTSVIGSFVKDLITPIIGLFGKSNFENTFLVLKEGTTPGPYTTTDLAAKAGAVTLNYGSFLTAVINFVIVGFALFLIVKAANRMKRKEEEAPAAEAEIPNDERLLTEIRDLLKAGRGA